MFNTFVIHLGLRHPHRWKNCEVVELLLWNGNVELLTHVAFAFEHQFLSQRAKFFPHRPISQGVSAINSTPKSNVKNWNRYGMMGLFWTFK